MWILCIIFIFIACIGVFGNSIVLLVIGLNRNLHDSTNILIANLALADLLFLTFCMPFTAYSYVNSWYFSESICYVMISLQYLTAYVSVWSLVFLAYDRYLAIESPAKLRSIRRGHKSIYVCILIWFFAFIINYPNMNGAGLLEQRTNETEDTPASVEYYCVDSMEIGQGLASISNARMFFWTFNVLAFAVPLLLSTIFYILLVKALWKEKMTHSKSSQRMKRHATKMVFTVILTFGICWFPQNMRFFFRGLSYPEYGFWEGNETVMLVSQCFAQILAYANSSLNPILYSILSERFRNGLKHAWRSLCSPSRRSLGDTYYRQTIYDSRTPYSRAQTPDQRRSLSEGRHLMAKEISSSAMESNEIIVQLERSHMAFQLYKPPLIPRPPTVQPENSSIRDSSGTESFPAIAL